MTHEFIMGLLVIATVCSLTYAIYVKIREKRYLREQFAFAVLTSTVSLIGLGIHSVSSGPPWYHLPNLWAGITGKPHPPNVSPDTPEQLVILLLVFIGCYFIHQTYKTWNGEKSVRQHEMENIHETNLWVFEGIKEARRLLFRGPPLETYRPTDYSHSFRPLETPVDTASWHETARELIQLRWRTHAFDRDAGWHHMESCWVGKNTKTHALTGLLCARDAIDDQVLSRFMIYVRQFETIASPLTEFYVATQRGSSSATRMVNGFQITIETFDSLLDALVDFEDYYSEIVNRVTKDFLPDSALTLHDVYVPPLASYTPDALTNKNGDDTETTPIDLNKYITEWLSEPSSRQLALLGEYGQGKSSAALKITFDLINNPTARRTRIPLLIELRGKSPSTLQPLELLGAWASAYQIDPRALFKIISAGRALLIFEGFDEMAEAGDLESRMNHFRALWKFCYPGTKMLITGRPNFFLDDKELAAALGLDNGGGSRRYGEALYLRFFREEQMREGLRVFDKEICDQIIDFSQQDQKFFEIAARPSLLYIIGLLWKSEDIATKTAINSALILDIFISHSYRRQAQKAEEDRSFMSLSSTEREYFHDGIAAYMVREKGNNQISADQFHNAVRRLYTAIPSSINVRQTAVEYVPTRPLKERMKDRMFPVEEIETDVRTYGILTNDYSRPGSLKFSHKSFFEFIFARYITRRLLAQDREETAAIAAATEVRIGAIIDLPVAVAFVGEIMSRSTRRGGRSHDSLVAVFDGIVLGGRMKYLRWVRTVILLECIPSRSTLSRMMTPSHLTMFVTMMWISLGTFGGTSGGIYAEVFSTNLSVALFIMAVIFSWGIILQFYSNQVIVRRVILWMVVLASMGATPEDISTAYGRLVSWRFQRARLERFSP